MDVAKTKRITYLGLFVAFYVILGYLSIHLGSIYITFGSFPVVLGALLFGSNFALLVGALGAFCEQLITYGLSCTTLLYIIPPALRGLIIGVVTSKITRDRRAICATSVFASVVVTIGNTLVNLIDSLIFGYYTPALIFGSLIYRVIIGIITAIVVINICLIVEDRIKGVIDGVNK